VSAAEQVACRGRSCPCARRDVSLSAPVSRPVGTRSEQSSCRPVCFSLWTCLGMGAGPPMIMPIFFQKKDEAHILFITSSSQWRSPLEMGRRTCLFILPRTLQPTNLWRRTCMGAEWRSPLEIGRANWIYVNGSHRNNESMDGVCNWRIWRESTSQSRRLVRGRLCSLASFTLLRVQKCN
jgi:hypothetical protein